MVAIIQRDGKRRELKDEDVVLVDRRGKLYVEGRYEPASNVRPDASFYYGGIALPYMRGSL